MSYSGETYYSIGILSQCIDLEKQRGVFVITVFTAVLCRYHLLETVNFFRNWLSLSYGILCHLPLPLDWVEDSKH